MVDNAPYTTYLEVMDEHNCSMCVHGDDISLNSTGQDSYQAVKDAGRFREVHRTIGVSTTKLIDRMLLLSKVGTQEVDRSNYTGLSETANQTNEFRTQMIRDFAETPDQQPVSVLKYVSDSDLATEIVGRRPKPDDKIIYIDGAFDLFHVGHAELFKKAKEMGSFLIIGIHDDETVSSAMGSAAYPLLTMHERLLSVLSCKYVDQVIIGAPYSATKTLLDNISVWKVVHGCEPRQKVLIGGQDPYEIPRSLGILEEVKTGFEHCTTSNIIRRVLENRKAYEERNSKKNKIDPLLSMQSKFGLPS